MGDLPDWTQSVSNAGTTLFSGNVNDGVTEGFNVAGNGGLLLRMSGLTNNDTVVAKVEFFTDSTLAVSMGRAYFTAAPVAFITSTVIAEIPIYAGWVVLTNMSGQQCTMRLTVATRVVAQPRVLSSNQGTRLFSVTTNMVSGVEVPLTPADGGDSTWANNAQVGYVIQTNINGAIVVIYSDQTATVRTLTLASVTANTTVTGVAVLPQGAVALAFIPLATAAASTALLYLSAAQL